MNTTQQQAQLTADYYQNIANDAQHNANFIAQCYHHHGPPQTVNDTPAYSTVAQAARQNLPNLIVHQTISSQDPALLHAKSQAAQDRVRMQRSQLAADAALDAEVKAVIAEVQNTFAIINQQAQVQAQQAQVKRSQVKPPGYRLAKSSFTGKPSVNRAIVNQSLGLQAVEAQPPAPQLPI